MKPTFACVLKMGGDYYPEHVLALSQQVAAHTTREHDFVCYSDVDILGVKTIPLVDNNPGWWSVPEVFRQKGPTIITGLDTVITDDLDPLFDLAVNSTEKDFWMIKAFNPRNKFASGVMAYNGDWSGIWESFNYPDSTEGLPGGEQDHTLRYLRSAGITPRILQNKISGIYSYKKHCRRRIPGDCRIMLFHGKPRPFEVPRIWQRYVKPFGVQREIPELWPNSTVYILGGGPSLLKQDLSLIKDRHILGVNQAYTLGPWVDVCYSGDKRWYHWNRRAIRKYNGVMITSYPDFIPDDGKEIINVGRVSRDGISWTNNKSICWNGNSGASAVNVAYWLGARRIILLGFDMKRQGQRFNWHNDYPKVPRRKSNGRLTSPYREFLECWDSIAMDAKHLGLDILNATPGGNLNIFPRITIEETL